VSFCNLSSEICASRADDDYDVVGKDLLTGFEDED